MYIKFELTFIMVLTFIHQNLFVYAQVNGSCAEFVDLEPKDILSKDETVKVTFKIPPYYKLKIIDAYFYEPERGRLNCTGDYEPGNLLPCNTERSDRKSYPYNTAVDFVLGAECRDRTDNSLKGYIHKNLTNYVRIVDPVIDYVSPHSIFLNHSTLFVYRFKEIHPRHSKTLTIHSRDAKCQAPTYVDKRVSASCEVTRDPSSERVTFYLLSAIGYSMMRMDERKIPFVTRPTLSKIIEPIFGKSCHPIHLTGQHLTNLEAFEFKIEKTGQTVKNCKLLNDTHYVCSFMNDLSPETASGYEKVSFYTHGSLLDISLYLVVKPVPNIVLVTYESISSTLTVHGENFEPEYFGSLSIIIKHYEKRSITNCSGPYVFDRESSTISCKTGLQLDDVDEHQALINISCYSIQFCIKQTGHHLNKSWFGASIAFNIIILLYLCLCQSPLKAHFCSSKEKGQKTESKSGVIYTQVKSTHRVTVLGKSLDESHELKGVSPTTIGPLPESKSSPISESASLKAQIHGHKESDKSSESSPNKQTNKL